MNATVAIVVALVVIAVVVFLAMRSRKPAAQLPEEEAPRPPLPKPEARPEVEAPRPEPTPVRAEPTPSPAEPRVELPPAVPAPRPSEPAVTPSGTPIETISAEPIAPSVPERVAPAPVVEQPAAPTAKAPREKRDIAALKKGLEPTRSGWLARLAGIFGGRKELDPELLAQIEETLITGDVGVKTTQRLMEMLKERLEKRNIADEGEVWSALREVVHETIDVKAPAFGAKTGGKAPLVILVVGVNGVGKTTTIGKLAARYKDQGKKVYLAAGDTFRAAAVAQLEAWGKRVGVPVVKGKDLSKPSAVVFDAVQTGVKEGADVIIADTAGRLHTKTPLMDELRKLRDAAGKALPGAPHEILLVLDATTGQNGLVQVKEFREALDLTGIVLTKLDGTAKGGVILGICDEFKLPVRFVGVGEKVDDLREFDADDFTNALFARPGDETEAA
jgi:fused signal recognition particle receptor